MTKQTAAVTFHFYVQKVSTANERIDQTVLWATDDGHYTQWIDDAKRFTEPEADAFIKSTRGRWRKWPVVAVESHAHRTVDILDLRRAEECDEQM